MLSVTLPFLAFVSGRPVKYALPCAVIGLDLAYPDLFTLSLFKYRGYIK